MQKIRSSFKWCYFASSCTLVLFASLISAVFPFVREPGQEFLRLGFPASFLTIHVSQDLQFAVHLGIGSLIFDLLLGYLLCLFIRCVWKNVGGK